MIVDAVVIGAGPNGLVAANVLVDAGWSVVVLEAEADPGGAVRSDRSLEPGFVTDRFSAFYPLAAASPHLQALDLEHHGLTWSHAPAVLAHPTPDGPTALLSRDLHRTVASLDAFAPGDGAAWAQLQATWARLEDQFLGTILDPFPPVRSAGRLAWATGPRGLASVARQALMSVRRLGAERFSGAGGSLLLAGSALHADLTPDSATSGLLGWLLTGIGQRHGWPVPRGGAQGLTDALVARLESKGGAVRCRQRVTSIEVVGGRASAVRTASGERVEATHGILADVVAPKLYRQLLAPEVVPSRVRRDIDRFQVGSATFKVNWTLDSPIPWADPAVAEAGTVHLADSMDELTLTAAQLVTGALPSRPFALVGQMTTADPTRSPPGTESAWAYTDVPQRITGDAGGDLVGLDRPDDAAAFAHRLEGRIELHAPGFRARIRHRSIQTPASMERDDANLIGGDKNLGTSQLHQQLLFRPTIGLARTETAIPGLFLASASAHPGGGVHGACGANAARAALLARRTRWIRPGRWRSGPSAPPTGDRGAGARLPFRPGRGG